VVKPDEVKWEAQLGPCEGDVFLATPEPIADVKLKAPHFVPLGANADVEVSIIDSSKRPIAAVVPVRVDISDSSGRLAEFSGYHAARDGKLPLHLSSRPTTPPESGRCASVNSPLASRPAPIPRHGFLIGGTDSAGRGAFGIPALAGAAGGGGSGGRSHAVIHSTFSRLKPIAIKRVSMSGRWAAP
jgi:hypothetical protein